SRVKTLTARGVRNVGSFDRDGIANEPEVGLGPDPDERTGRCPERGGILGLADGRDRPVEDVGDDLRPRRPDEPAADAADLTDRRPERRAVLECPAHLERDALHQRPQEVAPAMTEAEPDERPADAVVED